MSAIVSRIVEVCVFKREESVPKYLLLKRSSDDRIYPGIWQLVTGTMKEEETAANTAIRELAEESGLKPRRLWVAPHVSRFYVAADDTVHLSPMFAVEVSGSDPLQLSKEHQAFGWYSYEEAQRMLVWPGQRRGLEIVQQYIVDDGQTAKLTQLLP
jgi:dATP pyrophosphohydrolase